MCLSLASPPKRILACLDVRTTVSKRFNDRSRSSFLIFDAIADMKIRKHEPDGPYNGR